MSFPKKDNSPRLIHRIPRAAASIAAAALCLFAAAACGKGKTDQGAGGSAGGGAAAEQRELRVSQGSDVITMDPYFMLESPTFNVQRSIFDPLTDIDPQMKIVPALAESWENVEPTRWRLKLRAGVKFHDGQPFDAEDVRYSLRRAIDWGQSKVRSEIPTVKEIHIIDPLTVEIETTVPDAIIPTRLASVLILDKESSEAGIAKEGDGWLAAHANGTGPYKLAEYQVGSHVLLTANEAFRDGAPSVKRVRFLSMAEPATRMAALLNGELDILTAVPVQDVDKVRSLAGFKVLPQPSLRLIYLGLDVSRDQSPGAPGSPPNPLKDLRVRQAIYKGINIDLIVKTIMNGYAEPADQLFPKTIFGFNPEIARPAYDPEGAKKLLAEAGFPNGFPIRLDTPNDRYVNDSKIAGAVAQQLAQIGIQVDVAAKPKQRFFSEERDGAYSFFLIGWANTNGDGNGTFDHLLHTSDPAKNLGASNTSTVYSNPKVDALSDAAAAEFDIEKRRKLLQEAVKLVMDDLPHIPLHYQMDIYAVSDKVNWTPRSDTQVRGSDVTWK